MSISLLRYSSYRDDSGIVAFGALVEKRITTPSSSCGANSLFAPCARKTMLHRMIAAKTSVTEIVFRLPASMPRIDPMQAVEPAVDERDSTAFEAAASAVDRLEQVGHSASA